MTEKLKKIMRSDEYHMITEDGEEHIETGTLYKKKAVHVSTITDADQKAIAGALGVFALLRKGFSYQDILENKVVATENKVSKIPESLSRFVEEIKRSASVKNITVPLDKQLGQDAIEVELTTGQSVTVIFLTSSEMGKYLWQFNRKFKLTRYQTMKELQKRKLILINTEDSRFTVLQSFEKFLTHLLGAEAQRH